LEQSDENAAGSFGGLRTSAPLKPVFGDAAMPFDSYPRGGVFGPEATAAMGEAFDAACKDLHITDQSKALRTLIAILIIGVARQGELNPVRLRTAAVAGFAIVQNHRELDAPNVKAAS